MKIIITAINAANIIAEIVGAITWNLIKFLW